MQKSLDEPPETCYTVSVRNPYATVAQQVEQLTRNEQVVRSNRISSSRKNSLRNLKEFFQLYSPFGE